MKLSWIVFLLGAFELSLTERILFVVPAPSKSHYILHQHLMERLAEKGHEVTVIAPYKFSETPPRISEVIVPDTSTVFFYTLFGKNTTEGIFKMRKFNPLALLKIRKLGKAMMDKVMREPAVQDLLRSSQKFDLVIGEAFMMEGLVTGLAHKYKAPMLMTCPTMPSAYVNDIVGNPAPSAFVPEVMLGYTDEMNFLQRLLNYVLVWALKLVLYTIHLPQQNALMKEYFGEDSPSFTDVLHNNPIILINHHFSLGFPRPYIPNMIEIGGYHVRPAKPLPKDLEQFISEAKDGVILFSMGSILHSEDLPQERLDEILRALSRVKQKVLWKFENENLRNVPKNVKISKWLPQSDVLAHPNVKLFITHGGLLSFTEAILRGVPLVAIPIFADQPTNARLIEKLGVGVKLEYDDINENNLFNSIQKVLNNNKYSENVKMRSKMLNDRPLSPVDTAIYWIEYAIRHKGAPHLRSGATKLTWYQLEMLDVQICILSVVVVLFTLVKRISCCVMTRLRGDKNKKLSAKKRKIK